MLETVWQAAFPLVLLGAAYLLGDAVFRVGAPDEAVASGQHWEASYAKLGLGLLAITWWGIVLAEVGAFAFAPLVAAPVVVTMIVWIAGRRARRPVTGPDSGYGFVAAVVLTLVIAGSHFLPAFDVRLEARDPGVYYMAGVHLGKVGSIAYTDPTILELTEAQQAYFFPPVGRIGAMESNRFVGFYVQDIAAGKVVPQALAALPVWVGMSYVALAEWGAERATPVLAMLAILGLYLLTWRIVGNGWVAVAAAGLLSLSFVEAWFARYVAAEIPAQAFVMLGLYGLLMLRRYGGSFYALLGAAGLGLMWFAKAESMVLIVPLAALLLVDALRGTVRRSLLFWMVLGLLGAHTLLHAVLFVWPYYFDLIWQVNLRPPQFFKLSAGAAVGYLALLAAIAWIRARVPAVARAVAASERLAKAGRYVIALGLLAASVVGLWVAPEELLRGEGSWDSYNLVELGWAVSPMLLLMAIAGVVWLLLERRTRAGTGAVLGVILFACALVLWWRQIHPALLWAYRRWVPLVIPACYLAGVYFATRVGRWLGSRAEAVAPSSPGVVFKVVAGVVTVGLLVPPFLYHVDAMEPYRSHVEMPGVDGALEQFTRIIEPGALVLFEPRTLRGMVRFEIPLALMKDRRVLRIMQPEVDLELVEQLIWAEAARGRPPVYLVTTGYLSGLWRPYAELVHTFSYRTRRLVEDSSINRVRQGLDPALPRRRQQLLIEGYIYRLHPGGRLADLEGGLDVGAAGDLLYQNGRLLRRAELDDLGRTYRWTAGGAGFLLPGLTVGTPALVIVADADTPEAIGPAMMVAKLDGVEIGSYTLSDGWLAYRFEIPTDWVPDERAPPYLELEITPGYRPMEHVRGSTDRRYLGIKIDRISWAGTESPDER